ncbi:MULTISPECIES: hypothetical protein [Bacillus cereus group]|uniref:hypothetical protein n=1 Tax=Bacillus cereus group TaxID=86661 RepID=UPI000A3034A3|nr:MULTISPECIES: hypothetical protein [Bacillus cereus group]MBL3742462.1 hypothetical protein [Bacillus cereus]MBL3862587.1 hypothetical protein [Bacillus cereus]MEC3158415.1 hypothetical protein [Bacillus thuringiensis]SME49562.1 hypothetical protein BACERE00184_05273 [Bacillus cereus]HDR8058182.1 hypothetical protein [Bacillus cereus]
MEYTIQDIQKLKMIFGEKFDPFGTSNSRSDFSRITLSTIAKGLANYTKKYYRYAHYPAEFKGSIYDLKYFAKDAKLDIRQLIKIFESSTQLEALKNELMKNNIKLTYISGTIKLVEF